MHYRILIIILSISISSAQAEMEFYIFPIVLDSLNIDLSLPQDEAIYFFTFKGIHNKDKSQVIQYNIDSNKTKVYQNNGESKLEIKTIPGKHIFRFFTQNYHEIYSDSIEISSQQVAHYSINMTFEFQQLHDISEKPVIYLYPEEPTNVEFRIDVKGDNAFYYPTYQDSWKFVAQPNGELEFTDKSYNYLFWEASGAAPFNRDEAESGFIIEGASIVQFLEEKLSEAGLTSKEQADFITYWAPRMQKNTYNLIHFVFNEACEEYATFDISPQPDHIYRIYMKWTNINTPFTIEPQEIKKMNRNGFSVLEWGGQQSYFKRNVCRFPPLESSNHE